jgi:hypothetical protein
MVGAMTLRAASDYLRGLAELLDSGHPRLSAHLAVSRAALEGAAVSAWLSQPGITSLERIERHFKPHLSVSNDGPARTLILSIGRAADLEPSDIIHAITAAAGLDGEAVRNVRMLEHFISFEVREQEGSR